MNGFRFPLEAVLKLRAERERQVAGRLAEALDEASAADDVRDVLEELEQAGRDEIARLQGDVGRIQSVVVVLEHLARHLDEAGRRCDDARGKVKDMLDEFTDALSERRAIDRLKERQVDDWRVRVARVEQKDLDEVNTNRHGRPSELSGAPHTEDDR